MGTYSGTPAQSASGREIVVAVEQFNEPVTEAEIAAVKARYDQGVFIELGMTADELEEGSEGVRPFGFERECTPRWWGLDAAVAAVGSRTRTAIHHLESLFL